MKLLDVGAERAVLAGLFRYGIDAYIEISDYIDHGTFGQRNNQCIYRCIEKAIKSGGAVDLQSVLSAAGHLGLTEVVSTDQEIDYISSLIDFPVHKDNVVRYAHQIKKFEFARDIELLTKRVQEDINGIRGDESIDEVINILEKPVTEFLRDGEVGGATVRVGVFKNAATRSR